MDLPEEEEPQGAPDWLMTFSDLVSLLVTLFIMLLTFTTQETDDLVKVMAMIKGSFGITPPTVKPKPALIPPEVTQNERRSGVTRADLDETLDEELKINKLTGFVIDERDLDRGRRIVPETLSCFAKGSAIPAPEFEHELRRLARIFKKHKERYFRIEGHCDARSDLHSPVGSLNELAIERARRVADLMGLEGLQLTQILISSRGADRPRSRDPGELGMAKNRRVEIVILPLGED